MKKRRIPILFIPHIRLKSLTAISFLLTAFSILLTLFLPACKNGGTEPPPPERTPRDYEWTVDTLAYSGSFQTNMRDIWASSPTNVYVVGHNDQPGPATMFRYDGVSWKTTGFHAAEGGTVAGPVSLTAIHGFSADDIWVVGTRIYTNSPDSSLLIHFDGSQWTEYPVQGENGLYLQSIWGTGPMDVWAGGINTFLQYDGMAWRHAAIEIPSQGVQFLSINGLSTNEVYTSGWRQDVTSDNDSTVYLLFRYDGTAWSEVDSSIEVSGVTEAKFGAILKVVGGTLYSVYKNIFRLGGSGWERMLQTTSGIVGIDGSSSRNIVVAGDQNQIFHFNGVDWYRLPAIISDPTIVFTDVWIDTEQVFIIGNDGQRTYVLRGE